MVNTESDISFRQGGLRVDLRTRTLTLAGRAVKLGGRAFDVLHALVEQRDRVVAKQQLLEVVWPGLVVEENNLQVHVAALRKVLGSDAIVTVSGRGYRFTLVADPQTDDSVRRSTPVFETRQPPFAATTTLIGRDALVASACALLHQPDVRLVSMTGTGGSGKTRVGLRVSAEVAAAFQDGSYTVMLAPVRDAALVASAIATVLSIQETGSQPLADLLVGYLREREVLLTLDSFEHVLAATPLVATLLASCPRLKVLVTSRALLKLPGEHDVLVPALALPSDRKSVV